MGYANHASVSQIRYQEANLSDHNPIIIDPSFAPFTPIIDSTSVVYKTLLEPFDITQYLSTRLPIDMGLVDVDALMTSSIPNVLRMPLKFPNTTYRIPKELKALTSILDRVLTYENSINALNKECFAHITFDRSKVSPGEYHRFPGAHADGIQGTKLTPKIIVEHSYILTTAPATEFCLQPFFLKHLDEAKHNFFLEFDRQAKETNIYSSLPNHLYLIDPYMVHRTPKITETVDRLFLRITYAFSELQHPKNTKNSLFKGQEYDKRIDIRQHLTANEFDVPYHLYGLTK